LEQLQHIRELKQQKLEGCHFLSQLNLFYALRYIRCNKCQKLYGSWFLKHNTYDWLYDIIWIMFKTSLHKIIKNFWVKKVKIYN